MRTDYQAEDKAVTAEWERGKAETAAQWTSPCPRPDDHYQTDVNKGSINMNVWRYQMTERYKQGYRLTHVFEQKGNTVQIGRAHV